MSRDELTFKISELAEQTYKRYLMQCKDDDDRWDATSTDPRPFGASDELWGAYEALRDLADMIEDGTF